MADNIDRQHVQDAMDWVAAEQEEKNRQATEKKMLAEISTMRRKAELTKCIALDEMYSTIIRTSEDYPRFYGTKMCHMAMALVHVCAKVGYVDMETKRKLIDYLFDRLQYFAQKDE